MLQGRAAPDPALKKFLFGEPAALAREDGQSASQGGRAVQIEPDAPPVTRGCRTKRQFKLIDTRVDQFDALDPDELSGGNRHYGMFHVASRET